MTALSSKKGTPPRQLTDCQRPADAATRDREGEAS